MTKARINTIVCDTLYLQNELGDPPPPPQFFCLFDIHCSLSNCSQSLKEICNEKILGVNVLK